MRTHTIAVEQRQSQAVAHTARHWRARTPTCPTPRWNGERAARSINLKETDVRGVFSAKGPDTSVGGVQWYTAPMTTTWKTAQGVLKSSTESKVDDGQVEQEDIAPEEEAAAPRGDAQTSGAPRRARGGKKFGKGAALRPSRGHDAAHHDVLLPSPVLLRLPPLARVKDWTPEQDVGADLQARWVRCRWMPPPVTTSNHIQMYHRGTRRINFSKNQTHKRLGRSPRGT